jgi:hypothetical protein
MFLLLFISQSRFQALEACSSGTGDTIRVNLQQGELLLYLTAGLLQVVRLHLALNAACQVCPDLWISIRAQLLILIGTNFSITEVHLLLLANRSSSIKYNRMNPSLVQLLPVALLEFTLGARQQRSNRSKPYRQRLGNLGIGQTRLAQD